MADTDLDTEASEGAGASDASKDKSVNYESKYKGLSRVYEQLRKDHEKLQEKFETQADDHEQALAKVRLDGREEKKRLKELEAASSEFEATKAQLEKELTGFKSRADTATKLATKYPDLIEMFDSGDLREPHEFKTPEEYDSYLERMNKWASQVSTEPAPKTDETPKKSAVGATPSGGTRQSKGEQGSRTVKEIEEDLWNTDPHSSKEGAEKYERLIHELDAVQQAKRN
jgi:chromosome segregation ATPase